MSELAEAVATQGLINILGFLIILAIVLTVLKAFTQGRGYRNLMVDMYVVGTIKKLAKEDGIDLVAELSEYSRIIKRSDLNQKGLGKVIEEELKEKVAKVQEEKLQKK